MPNPSTITAELEQEYYNAIARADDLTASKASREQALREARALATELGIEGPPAVNGRSGYVTSDQLSAEREQLQARIDQIDRELEDRAEQRLSTQ